MTRGHNIVADGWAGVYNPQRLTHIHNKQQNKPDRATMRPDCVPTWSEIRADCVRQMDEQTEQIDKLLEYLT